MIVISCPSCHTSYETTIKSLTKYSGHVKCSSCGCKWQASNDIFKPSKPKANHQFVPKISAKITNVLSAVIMVVISFTTRLTHILFSSLWFIIDHLSKSFKMQVIIAVMCLMLSFINYYEVIAENVPKILYDYSFITSKDLHMQNFTVYKPSKNLLNISGEIINNANYSARITEFYIICLDDQRKQLATRTLSVDRKILQPRESTKIDTSFSLPDNTSDVILLIATPLEMRLVEL